MFSDKFIFVLWFFLILFSFILFPLKMAAFKFSADGSTLKHSALQECFSWSVLMKYSIIYKKRHMCILCCVKTAVGWLYCCSPDIFVFERMSL